MESKAIDLVLSGGGARGLTHIGVIQTLMARGYRIRSITGTSIGALVGAMFALGKLDEFARFMQAQSQTDIVRLMDFTLSSHGLIRGKRLFAALQKFAPDCPMEQLPVPLTIVATDLLSGREMVMRTGSVYAAVRASVAIPSVIMPVFKRGQMLVDGGVLNPFPLNHVRRTADALLVGVNLYGITQPADAAMGAETPTVDHETFYAYLRHKVGLIRDWKANLVNAIFSDSGTDLGYAGTFRRMSELMTARMALQSALLYRPDVLINIPLNICGLFDFHLTAQLTQAGARRTAQALAAYDARQPRTWLGRMSRLIGRSRTMRER